MRIDFKKILEDITDERIIELVTELGSDNYEDKGDYIVFKTICHNECSEDSSMKLYYYKKNKKFHCYTDCNENFNLFTLFQKRYELLGINYNFYKDIVLKISKGLNIKQITTGFIHSYKTIYKANIKSNVKLTKYSDSLLNIFINDYSPIEWLEDGINEEAMNLYNICYSISDNKIIIPHYDINNNLIGIRGRALNPEDIENGKYMPVSIQNKIYAHPLMYNVYGLNVVKENIKKYKIAIVAESEKSCLQYNTMYSKEQNICVACCGSNFHQYQMELLVKAGAEKIIIAFDREWENTEEKEKYFNKLQNMCKKYSKYCTMGFLFDHNELLNNKESPFDRGRDVFEQLYKKGVRWV